MPAAAIPQPIEVWRIDLTASADFDAGFALLDADEQARAQRLHFAEHRRRFVVAHAAVRCILAQRLGMAPTAIKFVRNPHGKPFLQEAGAPVFSLTHSHEMALCAVAANGELGVDIEYRRELHYVDLARRFFAAEEVAALIALPVESQEEAFFACWACKEAYIKAKGLGLSLPLNSFAVNIGVPAELTYSRHDPADFGRCRLWRLPASPGYCAALAYCGEAVDYVCRDWISAMDRDQAAG